MNKIVHYTKSYKSVLIFTNPKKKVPLIYKYYVTDWGKQKYEAMNADDDTKLEIYNQHIPQYENAETIIITMKNKGYKLFLTI